MGLLKQLVILTAMFLVAFGIIFFTIGVYGLAGGTRIAFTVNEIFLTGHEGGQTLTVVGILMLTIGIVASYYVFEKMK